MDRLNNCDEALRVGAEEGRFWMNKIVATGFELELLNVVDRLNNCDEVLRVGAEENLRLKEERLRRVAEG